MKKFFVILSMAILPMVALTSCNNDGDDDINYGAIVASDYTVDITVKVGEAPAVTLEDKSIKITRVSDKTAKVKVTGIEWVMDPDQPAVPVTLDEFTVNLSGTESNVAIAFDSKVNANVGGTAMPDLGLKVNAGKVTGKKTLSLPLTLTVSADIVVEITAAGDKVTGAQ